MRPSTLLRGRKFAHYHGIDVSRSALDIAEQTLRVLSCPVNLYESDFVQALKDWRDPVGVVWIGLSLHHVDTPEKLKVMRDVRRIVGGKGIFAIYENTSPDGEDREHWHRRWDLQKLHWTAHTLEEWDTQLRNTSTRPTSRKQLRDGASLAIKLQQYNGGLHSAVRSVSDVRFSGLAQRQYWECLSLY